MQLPKTGLQFGCYAASAYVFRAVLVVDKTRRHRHVARQPKGR